MLKKSAFVDKNGLMVTEPDENKKELKKQVTKKLSKTYENRLNQDE